MDDLMFGAEEKRPFPDTDYKNGHVKAVRGRMLKKLMKYELKPLFSGLWITLAILAGMTLFMCVIVSTNTQKLTSRMDFMDTLGVGILLVMLYLYAVMASVIVPIAISGSRYYSTFFKGEGYLTFSLPATAEEHILAKHLSGMLATAIGAVGALVSVIIVALCSGGFENTGVSNATLKGFSGVMYDIELALIILSGFCGIFCVTGASCCFAQKFDKRKHVILRFVLIYVLITLISSLTTVIGGTEMSKFFATEAGMHVGSAITLVLIWAVTAFCFWYERRTLKYKLNLK